MKKAIIPLFVVALFTGSASADYMGGYKSDVASIQFTVVEYHPSPLSLRLAALEALHYHHWEVVLIEKDRIVSSYKGRYIELVIDNDTTVTVRELPNDSGKMFNWGWLPDLEKTIVEQLVYDRNVQQVRSFYSKEQAKGKATATKQ